MINALANVNETSHALGYQSFLKQKKPFKQVGAKGFDNGETLDGWKREWMQRSERAGAEKDEVDFKAEQGEVGAKVVMNWLSGKDHYANLVDWQNRLAAETLGPGTFWSKRPIQIDKVAWTPCENSFENFINACAECPKLGCWSGTKHANNPSDVLLMVTNSDKQTTIIGLSLKATFKNAALTIANMAVCGFLYLIVDGRDLEHKGDFCTKRGPVKGAGYVGRVARVYEPWEGFKHSVNENPQGWPAGGTSAAKQVWWKKNVQPSKKVIVKKNAYLIKQKSIALGGVRDILFDEIKKSWGTLQSGDEKAQIILMPRTALKHVLAGILQFTHNDVAHGGCKVPYVKLTAFGNMHIEIKPPVIEKYLEGAGNAVGGGGGGGGPAPFVSVKIVKRASDSLMLCIYKQGRFVPYFLIRAKCAARPPSSLKIDIKPINTAECVQTGGGRRALPEKWEEYVASTPRELDVFVQNLLEDTFPDCNIMEGRVRPKRNCRGEIVNGEEAQAIETERQVCIAEIAAAGGRRIVGPPKDVEGTLKAALTNKLEIIRSHLPPHDHWTRYQEALGASFWKDQESLVREAADWLLSAPKASGGSRNNIDVAKRSPLEKDSR